MEKAFYERIEKSSAHTQNRIENGNFILKNPHLLDDLVPFCFEISNKLHPRASCILEKVFELQLNLSYKYLDFICENLFKLKNDSAIRSISRFLMFLVQDNSKKKYLSENQLEKITESSFDWLILDYKVAVKNHALNILIETGKNTVWVYPELQTILEKEIEFPSPSYRCLVKKFLRKIN